MFCLGIEEIDESQIHEIGDFDPVITQEFMDLDSFKEPKVKKRKSTVKVSTGKCITTATANVNGTNIILERGHNELSSQLMDSKSEWSRFPMSSELAQKLESNGYIKPTEIQSKTLVTSLSGKDVIAAAETGSGKTLAYGIPIVNSIQVNGWNGLSALILVPTRELAKQVVDHLRKISEVQIYGIYGGLSVEKQKRQLKRCNVLVATPGRLWALLEQEELDLSGIKFLCVDEADKMLEPHHFMQLDKILEKLNQDRQTLVFSATILPENNLQKQTSKGRPVDLFTQLLKRVQFKDKDPLYLNLSTEQVVAQGVMESQIRCLKAEKELMVIYLATKYPGKMIIFVNSIHLIRRLVPILSCLKPNVYRLHAEMQQKQRLKNLEKFTSTTDAILIASDVAARGLDIPAVDIVIHYQIPRSGEIYVHRSGRTGRLNEEGVSIILTAPEDQKQVSMLCQALNRPELVDFPVENNISKLFKEPLAIANEIDKLQHSNRKSKSEKDWFKTAAESADILYSDDDPEEGEQLHSKKLSKTIKLLELELSEMLHGIVTKVKVFGNATALNDLKTAVETGFAPRNHVSAKKRKLELKAVQHAEKLKQLKSNNQKVNKRKQQKKH